MLGSTGSIGATTLDLIRRFPDRFAVVALAAGKRIAQLADQIREFRPGVVAVAEEQDVQKLRDLVPGFRGAVTWGNTGLIDVATAPEAGLVVSALVGAVGLLPTLRAIEAGKDVALANKEVLVVAGELVTRAAATVGVQLFPIDSEHNAIFQALRGHRGADVRRLVLTASGGPFLRHSTAELERVTVESALQHPTWKMGPKITVDSATLMNKGLEVIEAHWLFGFPHEQIDVVIHPQSVIHSMVEYVDGSVIAQMGIPDMAIPISYILAYPERLPLTYLPRLDLPKIGNLEFFAPDFERFPCLALAYRALQTRGTLPAVVNAANEVLVAAFLQGEIAFQQIPKIIEKIVDCHEVQKAEDMETLLAADAWARRQVRQSIG